MAFDGPGLLDNDAAQDFVERVAEFGVEEVKRALREVLDHPGDYLDVDIAAEAWVAAEFVAARAGEERERTGNEPDTYDEAIASLPIDPALLEDSLRVLDRLENDHEDNNELAGFVADMGEQSAWHKQLQDLRRRLLHARARPKPGPKTATKRKKKKRPTDGDFWAFKVGIGFGFLRVRSAPAAVCAVYGRVFPTVDAPLSEVAATTVAFNVACETAVYRGLTCVGNEPLPADLREAVWFWNSIVGDPHNVRLLSSLGFDKTAPISEAHGLEQGGGYGPDEMAERLIAWIEKRDTTMEDNERALREKRWL